MDFEVIDYAKGAPVKVFSVIVENFPPHWHDEFEIIQVLKGQINLTVSSKTYTLFDKDVLLINCREVHQFHSILGECHLLITQIHPKLMEHNLPLISRTQFQCNSRMNTGTAPDTFNNIRLIINNIHKEIKEKRKSYLFNIYSLVYKLFGLIDRNFFSTIITEQELSTNNIIFSRLDAIFKYIDKNYKQEINTDTIVQILHLSKFYVSHFFKQHTCLTLGQYITNVRMEKAKALLMESEDSITNIILSCGFSNIKQFYKIFKQSYNCTPTEYKDGKNSESKSKKVHATEFLEGYTFYSEDSVSNLRMPSLSKFSAEPGKIMEVKHMRNIEIDFDKVKGKFDKYGTLCVGAGRAAEVLRKDFDNQLKTISEQCGFKYLRFHGIFHDDMAVYCEDSEGNPIYNWQYVDSVYDAILEKGVKPFVEISFTPSALASGEKTVFWWKANVTPPKDYDKWYMLVKNFVIHLEERYGSEEVLTWYFEIWNEPNHPAFFSADIQEYFKLYDYTSKAVKDVCNQYRVGGPATAGPAWISELIEHCHTTGTPIDFISTHTYGVEGDFDEFGTGVLKLIEDTDNIINCVKGVRNTVSNSLMPHLEIHYTEWSSSYSSRDPVHDSYFQAPYILYNLKRLESVVNSMSYWTFTDVFEEAGPPPSPFHGGFGLINLQSLKKPAFFAYKFLYELGDVELVNNDNDSWVCRNNDSIQALVWDFTYLEQDTFNQKFFKRDLLPKEVDPVVLKISGLEEGKYLLELHKVGYSCNDVYTDFYKMGSPNSLNKAIVSSLDKTNSGNPLLLKEIVVYEGINFEYTLDMMENDVYLLKLNKY